MTVHAGKVALVTGASRGIGRAIAERLAADGAFVVVHYNAASGEAEQTLSAIRAAGGEGLAVQADLGDPAGAETLVARVVAALGGRFADPRLDILVNNAGVGGGEPFAKLSPEDFDRTLTVNLRAPFFIIQGLLPHLRDGGRIINLSSMGTRAAYASMAAYAPAKAGLEALTRILANELGSRGITVNAVSPGATATDMNPRARDPVTSREVAASIALGRVGQPADIAGVVAALVSPDGAWITGQTIDASGGQRL
jgi:3-oxoacyl-[acyl-carrier protein] reductase